MAPILFIVPGIYEGPASFEPLTATLRSAGYNKIHVTSLPSTGTESGAGTGLTMDDDVAAIASDMRRVVDEAGADGVVTLFHSAGGFLGSAAMKGLDAPSRQKEGKEGGILKIIFLCAGVLPEGTPHTPPPFFEFNEQRTFQSCRDPLSLLFHDLSPDQAEEWAGKMMHQPANWDSRVGYCGWRDVPSVYIIAEGDRLLPVAMQEQCAELCNSRVVRIKSGHMAQLSCPEEVASIIGNVLEGRL